MFLIILALIAQVWGAEPFWRAKGKVYERIKSREIIVSVRTEDLKGETYPHALRILGGGRIETPCDFAYEAAQKYEELAKESGYVEEVKYTPGDRRLALKMAAFSFKESCTMTIGPVAAAEPRAIEYAIVAGRMTGFVGRFEFLPVEGNAKVCDIGTRGDFHYYELPLPKMFVTFGLEVMFQRMAGRLRAFTESNFKKRAP